MPRKRSKATATYTGQTHTFTQLSLDDAAEMMTLGPDHLIWDSIDMAPTVEEHFVRLQPPAGKAPEEVATVKKWLLATGGASAVKVLPVPVEEVPDAPEVQSTAPHQTIREVVMERAGRTTGIRDQGELALLLTQCMDKAGI